MKTFEPKISISACGKIAYITRVCGCSSQNIYNRYKAQGGVRGGSFNTPSTQKRLRNIATSSCKECFSKNSETLEIKIRHF